MLSRRNWVTDFIGHVLRKGLSDDPDQVFDSASELYSDWGDLDPSFAADSTFCPDGYVGSSLKETGRALPEYR